MEKYTRERGLSADQPDTATWFRVKQPDSAQNCTCSSASWQRDAHSTHSQGFSALRTTEKLPSTVRVTQLVAVLDLLLLQELKPWDKDAMAPSRPWTLHSQITSTEPKEQEEISNKHSDLPSPPALTSKTNAKQIKTKLGFFMLLSADPVCDKTNCELGRKNSIVLHCFQHREEQQVWCSPKYSSRYIRDPLSTVLHASNRHVLLWL